MRVSALASEPKAAGPRFAAGEVQSFALTADVLPRTDLYTTADVRLWIAGDELGEPGDSVVLSALVKGLRDFVASADARHCLPFSRMGPREILTEVWGLAYPDALDAALPREAAIAARRYVLSEASLNLLDAGWRVVAIRYLTEERFIWDRGEGTRLGDARVETRRVVQAIDSFTSWADGLAAHSAVEEA
jgi:hypothetical protein